MWIETVARTENALEIRISSLDYQRCGLKLSLVPDAQTVLDISSLDYQRCGLKLILFSRILSSRRISSLDYQRCGLKPLEWRKT